MTVCVPAVAEKTTGAMGNIVAATGLVKKDEFPTDMNVCIYCCHEIQQLTNVLWCCEGLKIIHTMPSFFRQNIWSGEQLKFYKLETTRLRYKHIFYINIL